MDNFSWVEFMFGTAAGMTFCWGGATIVIAVLIAWYARLQPNADSTDD